MRSVSDEMDKKQLTRLRISNRNDKVSVEVSCIEGQVPWLVGCLTDCETHLNLEGEFEDVDWHELLSKYQIIPHNLLDVAIRYATISGSFINKLFKESCLSEIHTLEATNCDFEDDGLTEYLKLLSEKKLHTLRMGYNRGNSCVMPVEILNNVTNTFYYIPVNYSVFADLGHFTDEILAEWMCPPKTLDLGHCTTGFTFSGIEQQLKKLHAENAPMQSFVCNLGYPKDLTYEEVRSFLDSSKELKWHEFTAGIWTTFTITSFGDAECKIFIHTVNK